jgi:PilZ domain-containing protein
MGALPKVHLVETAVESSPKLPRIPTSLPHRTFLRVPTHAISVVEDRRRSPRACLSLPLQLISVAGNPEPEPVTLVTKNISSSGIFFLAPRAIEAGTAIELAVALVERPMGRGSVRLKTAAHVVRVQECGVPGWYGFAASFDDIDFDRDDNMPAAH